MFLWSPPPLSRKALLRAPIFHTLAAIGCRARATAKPVVQGWFKDPGEAARCPACRAARPRQPDAATFVMQFVGRTLSCGTTAATARTTLRVVTRGPGCPHCNAHCRRGSTVAQLSPRSGRSRRMCVQRKSVTICRRGVFQRNTTGKNFKLPNPLPTLKKGKAFISRDWPRRCVQGAQEKGRARHQQIVCTTLNVEQECHTSGQWTTLGDEETRHECRTRPQVQRIREVYDRRFPIAHYFQGTTPLWRMAMFRLPAASQASLASPGFARPFVS